MSVSHPVRLLREELQLLQEQGSYVGEVVRAMDKKKVLVKVKARLTPREQPKAQRIPTPVCVALPRHSSIILGLLGLPGRGG